MKLREGKQTKDSLAYRMTEAARRPGRLAAVVAASIALLVSIQAAAEEPSDTLWALGPADSWKIQRLVDPGPAGFPGGYALDRAEIVRRSLVAVYVSGEGGAEITVRLRHPDSVDKPLAKTGLFAIEADSRADPGAVERLVQDLAVQVRAQEGEWAWTAVGAEWAARPGPPEPPETEPGQAGFVDTDNSGFDRRKALDRIARTWTPPVGLFLIALVVIGVALNIYLYRRDFSSPPRPETRPWDRFDLAALAVVLFSLGMLLHLQGLLPITGDEAMNIEPDFWATWFANNETHANPPLFRFLNNLLEWRPESLSVIRAPVAVFSALGIWLFYLLARRSTSGPVAVFASIILALHPLHTLYAVQQKSYTLWLLLLLLAHRSFTSALNDNRHWPAYTFWSILAVLTHYLTPLYLLGHLAFILHRRRPRLRSFLIAAAPAALAFLPFIVPVALNPSVPFKGGGALSGSDWWLRVAFYFFIIAGGLGLGAICLAPFLQPEKERRRGDTALFWLFVFGLGGGILYGLRTSIEPRAFYALTAFCLLWAASKLMPHFHEWRGKTLASASVGALILLSSGVFTICELPLVFHQYFNHHVQHALTAYEAVPSPARHQMFYPDVLEILWFEKTRRRNVHEMTCKPAFARQAVTVGGTTLINTNKAPGRADLDMALETLGQFDFFILSFDDFYTYAAGNSRKPLSEWVDQHCRKLASVFRPAYDHLFLPFHKGGAEIYRCGTTPEPNPTICEAPDEAADGGGAGSGGEGND